MKILNVLKNAIIKRVIDGPTWVFFLSIFFPLTILYSITADWELPYDADAAINAISAWHLYHNLSPFLPGYESLVDYAPSRRMTALRMGVYGAVSAVPPGAAFAAAPFYALASEELITHEIINFPVDLPPLQLVLPELWPATLAAIIYTAASVGLLGLIFTSQGARPEAWLAAYTAGLGTSAWSVASSELFMHGPAMFWISLGVYLSVNSRFFCSGLALALAILTRPHLAVIPASMGLLGSFGNKRIPPFLLTGIGSSLGVLLLALYHWFVFGKFSVIGGYADTFVERIWNPDFLSYLENIFGGLFDFRSGFLVWSPFLLALLPGIHRGWNNSSWAIRGAAVGGFIYLLLQYKMNRFNPANITLYRYPLEALTASAPLFFACYLHWTKLGGPSSIRRSILKKLIPLAVLMHGFGAIFL
ncbi:hypothetical protein F2Q65_15915 [Thiohalocapsa marina]|uniref:DUF2029 domain-containing protein n=1 Tax=Thiohalocapsa marina TaxID=424902 RepID=A0A5M8FFW1_9GAMM|nr:hypothetical protein [Thiohalocapsa marina]KAA6183294.1 hypothetical protein F2Q65_15915 [Thiohalocapsa marina]